MSHQASILSPFQAFLPWMALCERLEQVRSSTPSFLIQGWLGAHPHGRFGWLPNLTFISEYAAWNPVQLFQAISLNWSSVNTISIALIDMPCNHPIIPVETNPLQRGDEDILLMGLHYAAACKSSNGLSWTGCCNVVYADLDLWSLPLQNPKVAWTEAIPIKHLAGLLIRSRRMIKAAGIEWAAIHWLAPWPRQHIWQGCRRLTTLSWSGICLF